jgi:flagellar protein FlaG
MPNQIHVLALAIMIIHIPTNASATLVPTMGAQLPSARVITPLPNRTPEPIPVGPIPPNSAEKMTQAFQNVVDELNQQMNSTNRNLWFEMDKTINTPVVAVTDKNTGELVRQIPAEAVLRVAHSIENLKGVLYNAQA